MSGTDTPQTDVARTRYGLVVNATNPKLFDLVTVAPEASGLSIAKDVTTPVIEGMTTDQVADILVGAYLIDDDNLHQAVNDRMRAAVQAQAGVGGDHTHDAPANRRITDVPPPGDDLTAAQTAQAPTPTQSQSQSQSPDAPPTQAPNDKPAGSN